MYRLSLFALLAACGDHSVKLHDDTGHDLACDPGTHEADGRCVADDETDADPDADADGYPLSEDCDDTAATVNPAAVEACNGVDDDCDGVVDDGADMPTWYEDGDADGYGGTRTEVACVMPTGFVTEDGDCDDADAAVHPGAAELCTEEIDANCDGSVGYADADGDGTPACEDCNDADATAFPGGIEICDDADDDCDGAVDEDAVDAPTWYGDADGDGYGADGTPTASCDAPADTSAVGGDCDDTAAEVNPGAIEVCDAAHVDEDCDGAVDDADASVSGRATWHVDGDGDGYGSAATPLDACDLPVGFVANASDCDDANPDAYPGAPEAIGDEVDADCDGGELCYTDADADGYAATGGVTSASADADCADAGEASATMSATDCDDTDPSVSPDGTETCNSVDDDCDGSVDEGLGVTWYVDADGDGSGDATTTIEACAAPSGYAASGGDCDDAEPLAAPTLAEVCGDGIDNDCAGDLGDCTLDPVNPAATADYRLTGVGGMDYFGQSVALGDFDGDGVGDLAGGMYGYDLTASTTGAAAVWYGPLDASGSATATGDALLTGSDSGYSSYAGYAMSAGDHDGDGADDLLVGAYGIDHSTGAAYLVYGGSRLSSGEVATTAGVATFAGDAAGDAIGWSVGAGGDLDGDGTEELVVYAAGEAHVYYGSATQRSGTSAASSADAIIEPAGLSSTVGYSVAVVSDMDGDGLAELLLGAPGASTTSSMNSGAAYLFLGDAVPLSGTIPVSAADAAYWGPTAMTRQGMGVYDLTDVTGDGYADVGVYASGSDGYSSALRVYGGGGSLSTSAVATLTSDYRRGAYFGEEACSPGDLDGDGVNDLLVGYYEDASESPAKGTAGLWYGPVSGSISASTRDVVFTGATTGFRFGRTLPDRAGDVTGDGVPDVVIGDAEDDALASSAGAIYVWDGLGGE